MKQVKWFTLVELMVVMAIIAILATAGISSYGSYIKRARDTARFQDIDAIETALISYQTVNGRYPSSSSPSDDDYVVAALEDFDGFKVDPADGTTGCYADAEASKTGECGYFYTQCDNGGSYRLTTRFEDKANVGKYNEDDTDGEPGNIGGKGGSYIRGAYTIVENCGDPVAIRKEAE